MFSSLISAIQGGVALDDEDANEAHEATARDAESAQDEGMNEEGNGSFNLWALATQVADSVKQQAVEVVTTVHETNWSSELAVFGKAVQNETVELGTKTVKALEELPDQANFILPSLGKAVGKDVPEQLQGVQGKLAGLGKNIVQGTREVGTFIKETYDNVEAELDGMLNSKKNSSLGQANAEPGKRYSRFESEVSAMQHDSATYCDAPPHDEDFKNWIHSFSLPAKKPDIDKIIADNTFMAELQARIVPHIVEYDVFWTRYFYRFHKLQEQHQQRQQLAQRTTLLHKEEEQASWGDDSDLEDGFQDKNAHYPEGGVGASVSKTTGSQDLELAREEALDRTPSKVGGGSDEAAVPGPPMIGAQSDEAVNCQTRPVAEADSGVEAETASDSSSGKGWCVVTSAKDKHGVLQGQPGKPAMRGRAADDALDGDLGVVDEGHEGAEDEDWGNWE